MKNTIAAATLCSLLGSFAAVAGEELEEVRVSSERVSYADLNLDNQEGRDALRARLKSAAKRVCRDVVDSGSGKFTNNRECREIAFQSAVYATGLEARTARVEHQQ